MLALRSLAKERARGSGGKLAELLAGHRGVPLSGYMPIRSEIDPLPVMAEASAYGAVGVPVIVGKGQPLVFHRWTPDAAMVPGPFGAMVPAVAEAMAPQIIIVPMVAFDRTGGRLGYGGGFYDRTLAKLRQRGPVLAVGFAFSAQQVDSVPVEVTDQTLDLIVTETGIIAL